MAYSSDLVAYWNWERDGNDTADPDDPSLGPKLLNSRASPAYALNSARQLVEYPASPPAPNPAERDAAFRITHDPATGARIGHLYEHSSSQQLRQSNNFLASWTFSGPAPFVSAAPPLFIGQDTWEKENEAGQRSIGQSKPGGVSIIDGSVYTFSGYIRKEAVDPNQIGRFQIAFSGGLGAETLWMTFNVNKGNVEATGGAVNNVILAARNELAGADSEGREWQRISLTVQIGAASTLWTVSWFPIYGVDGSSPNGTIGLPGFRTFQCFQYEEQALPTSWIESAAVENITRQADVLETTDMSWYAYPHTYYTRVVIPDDTFDGSVNNGSTFKYWFQDEPSSSGYHNIACRQSDDRIRAYAAGTLLDVTGATPASESEMRVATGADQGSRRTYVNALSSALSGASGIPSARTKLNVGQRSGSFSYPVQVWREIRHYDTRRPDTGPGSLDEMSQGLVDEDPGVPSGVTIDVPSASLGYDFYVPSISGGASVDVPDMSIGYDLYVPTIQAAVGVQIDVPSAGIGYDFHVPSISGGASIGVPDMSVGYDFHVPTITAVEGVYIVAPTADISYQFYVPSIETGVTVDVPSASLDLDLHVPLVGGGANIVTPDMSVGYNFHVPSIQATPAGTQINVPAMSMALNFTVPLVSAQNVTPELTMWWSPAESCGFTTDMTMDTRTVNANPGFTIDFTGTNENAPYYDANGDLQSNPADDTPRFDHAPGSGTPRGILAESLYNEIPVKEWLPPVYNRNPSDSPDWYRHDRGTFYVYLFAQLPFANDFFDTEHNILSFTEVVSPGNPGSRNTNMTIRLGSVSNPVFNAGVRDSGSDWPCVLSTPVNFKSITESIGGAGSYWRVAWAWRQDGGNAVDCDQQLWVGNTLADLGAGLGEGILSGELNPASVHTPSTVYPTLLAVPDMGFIRAQWPRIHVLDVRFYDDYMPLVDPDFMKDLTSGRISECGVQQPAAQPYYQMLV